MDFLLANKGPFIHCMIVIRPALPRTGVKNNAKVGSLCICKLLEEKLFEKIFFYTFVMGIIQPTGTFQKVLHYINFLIIY